MGRGAQRECDFQHGILGVSLILLLASLAGLGAAQGDPTGPSAAGKIPSETTPSRKEPGRPDGVKAADARLRVRALFRRAQEHYFKKNFHTAAELLKRVVEADPEHAEAHAYLGDVFLMQQQPDAAIAHIRIAIELSKDASREWFRLGQALFLKKDPDGALEAYKRAYTADPKLHEVLFQTGTVKLHLLRDPKATVRDWKAFRKLVPSDPQGPAIDRAIRILEDPNFKFPASGTEPCLPGVSDSRVPDRKPPPAKRKEDNRSKEIIPVEEL